jgi:hypothetical protein
VVGCAGELLVDGVGATPVQLPGQRLAKVSGRTEDQGNGREPDGPGNCANGSMVEVSVVSRV